MHRWHTACNTKNTHTSITRQHFGRKHDSISYPIIGTSSACSSSNQPNRSYVTETKGLSKRWVNEMFNSKNRLKHLDNVPQADSESAVRREKDRYIRQLLHGTVTESGESRGVSVHNSELGSGAHTEKQKWDSQGTRSKRVDLNYAPISDAPWKGKVNFNFNNFPVPEIKDGSFTQSSAENLLTHELLKIDKAQNSFGSQETKEEVIDALRMYRLLRPEADPFFEEDAMHHMSKTVSGAMGKSEGADLSYANRYSKEVWYNGHVPVVNPTAFIIALQSVTQSLANDLEEEILPMLISNWESKKLELLPEKNDTFRFAKLMDILLNETFVGLKKIEDKLDRKENIKEWLEEHWDVLKHFLPKDFIGIRSDEEMKLILGDWLHGHIGRIIYNQKELKGRIWQEQQLTDYADYRFSEDFAYDQFPLSAQFVDERNLEFPIKDAGKYFDRAMQWSDAYDENATEEARYQASNSFQEFICDLEKIGLREWLKIDVEEDLTNKLPNWKTGGLSEKDRKLEMTDLRDPETSRVAKMMLQCAAQNKSNLLDFEAIDPIKLMHSFPHQTIAEELHALPQNPWIGKNDIDSWMQDLVTHLEDHPQTGSSTTIDGLGMEHVIDEELTSYSEYGPIKYDKDGNMSWKKPTRTMWDPKREMYIREKAIDPMLKVNDPNIMRQVLLKSSRVGSMNKDGRIYFFRAIVAVGNGQGTFGFGVGFGNNMIEAKADAALKAMQNLEFLDIDELRMLCTPCMGEEYSQRVEIIPRPLGRGIVCNKKFLPLAYVLGLDNVKLRFMGKKWFSRIKALKRALDQIVSRRTLANMTGQKYASLVAPGDHWIHWPDRWFQQVREGYDAKYKEAKIERKYILKYKKRGNVIASPKELKPGIVHRSPIERKFRERHLNWHSRN